MENENVSKNFIEQFIDQDIEEDIAKPSIQDFHRSRTDIFISDMPSPYF